MDKIHLVCQACGSDEYLNVGTEDDEKSLDDAKKHFKGKTKLHLSSLKKKHTIDQATFGYALYSCPTCDTLHNPYAVEVEYDGLMVFKPFYKCQVCLNTLQKVNKALELHACTACGKRELTEV